MRKILCLMTALAAVWTPVQAAEGTFEQAMLTPEAALTAAQAALRTCRDRGWQVAVAVVDRGGNVQALLRDRYAGPHTPGVATGKAWTAVSFRTNTTELVALTGPGMPQAGLRDVPGATVIGGGVKIEAAGALIAAIGVSGAPGGEADDVCAKAGVAAIRDLVEF